MNTDVDRPEACTVAGSHVLVERLDSVGAGELTELLVHVVGSRAGVVSEPDTEVLDLERLLFVDLRMMGRKMGELTKNAQEGMGRRTTFMPMISPLAFLTFFS